MKKKQAKQIKVATAQARYIRISPRKTREVIDLIRGKNVGEALVTLAAVNRRAKKYVEKVLKSAMSNAKQNPAVNPEQLKIAKITADGGPMLKRFRAAAMGRATTIRHRTTHLTVELAGKEEKQIRSEKKSQKKGKLKK